MNKNKMTFFLLHVIRMSIVFGVLILTMIFMLSLIIFFDIEGDILSIIFIFGVSIACLADIFVFMKFKGDLFTEKYSNTNSQWIFQIMLVIDFIAAPLLFIYGVVKTIQYLI